MKNVMENMEEILTPEFLGYLFDTEVNEEYAYIGPTLIAIALPEPEDDTKIMWADYDVYHLANIAKRKIEATNLFSILSREATENNNANKKALAVIYIEEDKKNLMFRVSEIERFEADTEPAAIFRALQWYKDNYSEKGWVENNEI